MATIDLNNRLNKTWLHPTGEAVLHVEKTEEPKEPEDKDLTQNHEHFEHEHEIDIEVIKNAFDVDTAKTIDMQQGRLENAISNLEGEIAAKIIKKVQKTKNAFDDENDVMSARDKAMFINELTLIVAGYYKTLFPIFANQLIKARAAEFGQESMFNMTNAINRYIQVTARRASDSHVNTIIQDLLKTAHEAYEDEMARHLKDATEAGKKDQEAFEYARKRSLEGASQQRIISDITTKYQDISKNRAKTIARTETNRAFTQSQFQADLQFLRDTGLMDRAYKQWITRSENPCPYCMELASRGPIPFKENFESLGAELHYDYTKKNGEIVKRTLKIDYEDLEAGNAHVNCQCKYKLVIMDGSGNFVENNFKLIKVPNKGYNPNRDPKSGRFSTGLGGNDKLVGKIESQSKNIQELNDKLSSLKKRQKKIQEEQSGFDSNSKEFKDLDVEYESNTNDQYKVLDQIMKARESFRPMIDDYFNERGVDADMLAAKIKNWGDGEWMDSIGPTGKTKPTSESFSQDEVVAMKNLNTTLYKKSTTMYRGMHVPKDTKNVTFKEGEVLSFSESKEAADRFGRARAGGNDDGVTISQSIKPNDILISHKWAAAYSAQVSTHKEVAVSFEDDVDISLNLFKRYDNKGYNPNRDPKSGRFSTGTGSAESESKKYREFKDKNLPDKSNPEHFKEFIKTKVSGKPSTDKEAVDDILAYQANSQHVNRYLAEHPDGKFVESMTRGLDKSFTWTAKEEFTTYRKLGQDYYKIENKGQTFTEPNYGSSSINPREADQSAWGNGPILRVKVPKGTKVSIPDLYSGSADSISIYSQQEVLLPRNTTYEVTKVSKIPLTGEKFVDVKIIKGDK